MPTSPNEEQDCKEIWDLSMVVTPHDRLMEPKRSSDLCPTPVISSLHPLFQCVKYTVMQLTERCELNLEIRTPSIQAPVVWNPDAMIKG